MIGAVAGLFAGFFWSASADAGYESNGTVFVAFAFPQEEKDPFGGSQFVSQRIESYAQLGESAEVLQAVADDVGGRRASDLVGHVKVSAVPGTVLLRITAEDSDRNTSLNLVNSVMTHLSDAVVAVEAGGPDAISPIGLVPIQPPISGPASSIRADLLRSIACFAIGLILGAAVGRMLSLRKTRGTPRASTWRDASGKHREAAAAREATRSRPSQLSADVESPAEPATYAPWVTADR